MLEMPTPKKKAELSDDEFEKRIRDITNHIMQAAKKSSDLKTFLDQIVEVGAEKLDARSCAIFLLDGFEGEAAKILRRYSSSGEVGKILAKEKARYYIPDREIFKNNGDGKNKIEKFLLDYFEKVYYKDDLETYKKDFDEIKKSPLNKLISLKKPLMTAINEYVKVQKIHLETLIENETLPMGITAYVVKAQKTIMLNYEQIREHKEWRGTYEGFHELCTALIETPLTAADGTPVGMIKIENHTESDSIHNFDEYKIAKTFEFSDKHKNMLIILANSIIIGIEDIMYREDTYKKLFGNRILQKISEINIPEDGSKINKNIHKNIMTLYNQLNITIEDISGLDEIYNKTTSIVILIAQELSLHETIEIIHNVGPAFETLLGTDVRYREHFMHQFQVFLLGYYIINEHDSIRTKLKEYLNKGHEGPLYDLDDVLRVWFISSIFHDTAYSVEKIEKWLDNYFERVKVPSKYQIYWSDIYSEYESCKTELVEIISNNHYQLNRNNIAVCIKDAFIEQHDHGVISGLMMMKEIKKNNIDSYLLNESCSAISLHNDVVYSKISQLSFKDFPFAFLLVYCDNAQEWGRPQAVTSMPFIHVKLEDVNIIDVNGIKKVETKLRYRHLDENQKILVGNKTLYPMLHWHTNKPLGFSVILYEGDATEPFRDYSYPTSVHDINKIR